MKKLNARLIVLAITLCGASYFVTSIDPSQDLAHHKKEKANTMENIYSFRAKSLDGKEIDMSQYKGKVLLVVNTASNCGFTPQYTGLEELNRKYKSKGLEILGFPCNQFGAQEPGNSEQIASFCQKNYGVDFQMFDKVDVNGPKADPIYKYLTSAAPGIAGTEGIKWNFTKFLIDRDGKVIGRFAPNVKPETLESDIEKLL